MVVINENDVMIDFVDIDPNINDEKKDEVEWWGIYIDVGGERWGICIDIALLYLLFLL